VQFDKLLASDAELASAFAAVDRSQQQLLSTLRTRPRAPSKVKRKEMRIEVMWCKRKQDGGFCSQFSRMMKWIFCFGGF
jgi:hypothetical protein